MNKTDGIIINNFTLRLILAVKNPFMSDALSADEEVTPIKGCFS